MKPKNSEVKDMSLKISELRTILEDFKDDDDICICSCAEELLIKSNGQIIHRIPLNEYVNLWG